jgi:hypothetical protein
VTIDRTKALIADLARPFALYSVAGSTSFAIAHLAWKGGDLSAAAVFITAALGGLVGLYVGKAWENAKVNQHAATVETAKAAATPAPGTATVLAGADVKVEAKVTEAAPDDDDPAMYGGPRP